MKRQILNWQNRAKLLTVIWAVAFFAFEATPAHAQLTELYGFQYSSTTTSNYPDGETPMAELIQGADGNYYTTTNAGGSGGGYPSTVEGTTATTADSTAQESRINGQSQFSISASRRRSRPSAAFLRPVGKSEPR